MKKLILISMLLIAACACTIQEPKDSSTGMHLVRDGQVKAVIVRDENAPAVAEQSINIFNRILKRMTGVTLPVVLMEEYSGDPVAVFIGTGGHKPGYEKTDPGQDIFRIIAEEGKLVLTGNDADGRNGTLYAVFEFFNRLGCDWFGPDPLWHVIPEETSIFVPRMNILETADFRMRNIWQVNRYPELKAAWKLGGEKLRYGHAMERLVPGQLEEAHPDWFMNGRHPDINHPEVFEHVVSQFEKKLSQGNTHQAFSISLADTFGVSDTEYSKKTGGNIGYQMLGFANRIAERLDRKYKGRYTLTFLAYWETRFAPTKPIKAHPAIRIMYVNEGNKAASWQQPEPEPVKAQFIGSNNNQKRELHGWLATKAGIGIYDWMIPGFGDRYWTRVPMYTGPDVVENLRYWHENGVEYMDIETGYEDGDAFPLRWAQYYLAAKSMWDTGKTDEEILKPALDKLYGQAAPLMWNYYRLLSGAMRETPEYRQFWHYPEPETVYTGPVIREIRNTLDEAYGKVSDELIRARIQYDRYLWTNAELLLQRLVEKKREDNWVKIFINDTFILANKTHRNSIELLKSYLGIGANMPVYLNNSGSYFLLEDKTFLTPETDLHLVTEVEVGAGISD